MKRWLSLLLTAAICLSAIGLTGIAESGEPASEPAGTTSEISFGSDSSAAEKPAAEPSERAESDASTHESETPSADASQSAETPETAGESTEPSSEATSAAEEQPSSTGEAVGTAAEGSAASTDSGSVVSEGETPTAATGSLEESEALESAEGASDLIDGESAAPIGEGAVPEAEEESVESGSQEAPDASGLSRQQVLNIQGCLIALSYLSASQRTGVYDEATRSAVISFQSDNGLSATGVCDSATITLLERRVSEADGGTESEAMPEAEESSDGTGGEASDISEAAPEGEAIEGIDDGSSEGGDAESPVEPDGEASEASEDETIEGEPLDPSDAALAILPEDDNADDADTIDEGGLNDLQIQKLQRWLRQLGYLTDDQLTGQYDEATEAAIARFQSENDLTATETCDSATYRLIYESYARSLDDRGRPGGFRGGGSRSGGSSGGSGGAGAAMGEMEGLEADDPLNGITPGEALTSTHVSGDQEATRYGALSALSVGDMNIRLSAGSTRNDLAESTPLFMSYAEGCLSLIGGSDAVQRWQLDGVSLRALARTGLDRLALRGERQSVTLNTACPLSGAIYNRLRAAGHTDNTFVYTVTLAGDDIEIAVSVGKEVYSAIQAEDGTLELTQAGEEGSR